MSQPTLADTLSTATPCTPVRIGTLDPLGRDISYFFNGHGYYAFSHHGQRFAELPELDAATLRIKGKILGDGKSTIIGCSHFAVPLSKSRRIGKYGHYYFKIGEAIYQDRGPNAGVSLVERPDMDAKTLSVLDEDYAKDAFHYFRRDGEKLPVAELGDENELPVRLPARFRPYQSPFPQLKNDPAADLDTLWQWLMEEGASSWAAYAADDRFYPYWLAYFKLAARHYAETRDAAVYENALAVAGRYGALFVAEPNALDELAALHEAARQPQRLNDTMAALRILKPEDPAFTPDIARLLEQTLDSDLLRSAPEQTKPYLCRRVLARYRLLDRDELEARWGKEAPWFVARQTEYFERYVLTERMVSVTESSAAWRMYQAYKEYALLNPLAHLQVANGLFTMAHHWHNWSATFFNNEQQGRIAQAFYIAHRFFQAETPNAHGDAALAGAGKVDLVALSGGLDATQQYCERVAQAVHREITEQP
ncbi:hypothetical protein [Aquisalimonas asiatica]|uniref:Uncharacterized protein n=1 Tax=Aquisalimonas asiatica TaxID=406100 RepID=A0A1H8VT75_9GAMM|nr:hypothetical protein [Aquisalimonas asiatica]SEP18427.1 hypothetical protein SAMN04488052_1158 [Aquisalimonas asiatica]